MSKWTVPFLFSLFSIFATSAQASTFIGASVNFGSGTQYLDYYSSADEEFDITTNLMNIHLGFISNSNNRFLISYETGHLKDSSDTKAEVSGLRFDGEFVYGTGLIQPFFGIGIGYYNSKDLNTYNGESLDAAAAQINAGIKINAYKHVEFSVHAQYQAIFWQDIEMVSATLDEEYSSTSMHLSLGAGVDFKF